MYALIACDPRDPTNNRMFRPRLTLIQAVRESQRVQARLGWTPFIWRNWNQTAAGDRVIPMPLPR